MSTYLARFVSSMNVENHVIFLTNLRGFVNHRRETRPGFIMGHRVQFFPRPVVAVSFGPFLCHFSAIHAEVQKRTAEYRISNVG
jgi:hypothetical protein